MTTAAITPRVTACFIFVEATSFTVERVVLPAETTDAELKLQAKELFLDYGDCRIVATRGTKVVETLELI